MSLADRCRNARRAAGLSVGQAQRVSGVERIDGIESGRLPTSAELTALADVYGVAIEWLRDGEQTPISDEAARAIGDADISDSDRGELIELLSTVQRGEVSRGR